jgi:hypothetical protein
MKGLSQMYGDGLVIITDGPLFESEFMIIALPTEEGS